MNLNRFYILILLVIISCKTNTNFESQTFLCLNKVSNKQVESLFKYVYPINRKYFTRVNDKIKIDSFKPIIFSYVKPLDGNKKIPQKIFENFYKKTYAESIDYFHNDLNGKSISYLEKDNEIVFRHFYQDYNDILPNDNNPKNKTDVINYLSKNKIKYKLIRTRNKLGSDILDFDISDQFLRVVANPTFCESYSCYDVNDSINIESYRTIIASFYR